MKKILALLSAIFLVCGAQAVSLPEYHTDMIKSYGLTSYIDREAVKTNLPNIKIAVLERGFAEAEVEGNLPAGCVIVNQYDEDMITKYDLNPDYEAAPLEEAHGRRIAQLVWAMTGMDYDVAPQIYLLNANGLTNFRRAVRYAILENVDIIVYAQNWEYGGNYDGKGFVNATVNEAIEAGITWINAAGNYGQAVYNDNIRSNKDGNLLFNMVTHSKNKDKLFFTVKSDDKDARVICVWNDFSNDRDYQAVKDLDLYVYEWNDDELGECVGQSTYAQVAINAETDPELAARQASQLAREEISLSGLRKNHKYAIMVRDISGNFVTSKDRVRVIVHANSGVLTFDDHTTGREIMIPADNPGVIAVGDLSDSSSTGPTADNRRKPEVILSPWMAEGQTNVYSDIPYAVFSDDTVVAGTSADAAIFAGIVATLKANKPTISRTELLQFAGRLQAQWRKKSVEIVEPQYTTTYSDDSGSDDTAEPAETYVIVPEIVTVYEPVPVVVGTSVGIGFGCDDFFFFGVNRRPITPPPPIVRIPPPAHHPIVQAPRGPRPRSPFVKRVQQPNKPNQSGITISRPGNKPSQGMPDTIQSPYPTKRSEPRTPSKADAPSRSTDRGSSPRQGSIQKTPSVRDTDSSQRKYTASAAERRKMNTRQEQTINEMDPVKKQTPSPTRQRETVKNSTRQTPSVERTPTTGLRAQEQSQKLTQPKTPAQNQDRLRNTQSPQERNTTRARSNNTQSNNNYQDRRIPTQQQQNEMDSALSNRNTQQRSSQSRIVVTRPRTETQTQPQPQPGYRTTTSNSTRTDSNRASQFNSSRGQSSTPTYERRQTTTPTLQTQPLTRSQSVREPSATTKQTRQREISNPQRTTPTVQRSTPTVQQTTPSVQNTTPVIRQRTTPSVTPSVQRSPSVPQQPRTSDQNRSPQTPRGNERNRH